MLPAAIILIVAVIGLVCTHRVILRRAVAKNNYHGHAGNDDVARGLCDDRLAGYRVIRAGNIPLCATSVLNGSDPDSASVVIDHLAAVSSSPVAPLDVDDHFRTTTYGKMWRHGDHPRLQRIAAAMLLTVSNGGICYPVARDELASRCCSATVSAHSRIDRIEVITMRRRSSPR